MYEQKQTWKLAMTTKNNFEILNPGNSWTNSGIISMVRNQAGHYILYPDSRIPRPPFWLVDPWEM